MRMVSWGILNLRLGEKVVRWFWIRRPGETQGRGEDGVPRLVVQLVICTRALTGGSRKGLELKAGLWVLVGHGAHRVGGWSRD